jgi:galactose mutarotase-like enzyme
MPSEKAPSRDGQDVTVASPRLAARVKPLGAELCSLRDAAGREFLWQAGAAWPRHAPLLFPCIGRLKDDTLRLDGRRFPMGQHGFARDHAFDLVEQAADACRFRLRDSAATRAIYPFPFRLDVAYAAQDATLDIVFTVTNTGDAALPFSIGAHPAFAWPLPGAGAKDMHRLTFEKPEPGTLHRPNADGLLRPLGAFPAEGRTLPLNDALFDGGALVLLPAASRSVRFGAPDAPGIEVTWDGFEELGVWTKPGAPFLCIEPWAGHADLAGTETDFRSKPGIRTAAPGESRAFRHSVTLLD